MTKMDKIKKYIIITIASIIVLVLLATTILYFVNRYEDRIISSSDYIVTSYNVTETEDSVIYTIYYPKAHNPVKEIFTYSLVDNTVASYTHEIFYESIALAKLHKNSFHKDVMPKRNKNLIFYEINSDSFIGLTRKDLLKIING